MSGQTELFGGAVSPGQRVRVRLWTGARASGVVVTEIEHPELSRRPNVWVQVDDGPAWATEGATQFHLDDVEASGE